MKVSKSNYGGIEEDLSLKALAVFFIIGLTITMISVFLLFNI
jgi:hypothetical protein